MTTEQDINQQLHRDVEAHNGKIYDGFLPDNFMASFKEALMDIPPGVHQLSMEYVESVIAKRNDEVSVLDVGTIINLIYMCPFRKIYSTLEEAIKTTKEFDRVRDEYNKKTEEFNKSMARKRKKLLEIAGIKSAAPFQNGMRVIGEA